MDQTKNVPIHSLTTQSHEVDFDLMLWGKKDSRYNSKVPHKHNYNEILIFFKGGGFHEIEFEDYAIESFSVHFVKAGMVHLVKRNVHSSGCSLLFKMEFFSDLPLSSQILSCLPIHPVNINAHPVLNLSAKGFAKIKNSLACLQEEYHKESPVRNALMQSYLQSFLLECTKGLLATNKQNELSQKKLSASKLKIKDFLVLAEQHFKEHFTLSDYARLLNINSNYLNELCKKELGKTASSLIHEKMIKEIKSQLCYTGENIKSIAFALNFKELPHFRQYFQKHTGFTPTEFRKKML
jgi:AraC family transcriptional regulator, transcriptional activator of pobA